MIFILKCLGGTFTSATYFEICQNIRWTNGLKDREVYDRAKTTQVVGI